MEVILLQNMVIRHKRFEAGTRVVVDEVIGKYLIENDLACELPLDEKPKPKAARKVAK